MFDINQLFETEGLFLTKFSDSWQFIWRLLSVKEYQIFRSLRDTGTLLEYSLYIEVFKRCYMGKSLILNTTIPIGMLVSMGQLIMWLSGDCELETIKEDILMAREAYPGNSVNERMRQVIYTAFPSYTIEDVESWSRPKLLRVFVLSESILEQRLPNYKLLNVDDITRPGEEDTRPDTFNPFKTDFTQEAKNLEKELGIWSQIDSIELEDSREKKLTTDQARKLDRINKTRR